MLKSAQVLAAMGIAAGASGCVDARGSFDQFADRVGFIDASTVDRPGGGIHDITGTFHYVTHAGFETSNSPDYYIQFVLRSTLTMNTDGTATFMGTVTPLCVYDTCTTREEIPPALPAESVTVSADGTFTSTFGGTLPGGANPFTGTNQPLTATAAGTIYSADFFCGSVSGSAAGLDLAGSSFAAYRITDTTPSSLPDRPAACPTNEQDAGVIDAPVDAGVDAATDAAVDAEPDAT